MAKKVYKTTRKYKCPFCEFKAIRSKLIDHVQRVHEELIPEGYTASRCIYDYINGKNYGICMICKKKVYTWNDKIDRYNNLCDDPKCREEIRRIALERHLRVYNKPTLLNDPEHQEKMLANRKISGTYIFSDGGKVTYTGKYEKKTLEFMDQVLNIPSTDIQSPGPILEYIHNGEKHHWITDIFYIPGNLVIEVKDGGSNPNNRPMKDYREKQIDKETMITELGKFNYLRLTNNDFSQLLAIFADMKYEALENINPSVRIHINEEVGGLPPQHPPEAYIIPYGMNNVFDGIAYGDSVLDKIIIKDEDDNMSMIDENEFNSKYTTGNKVYYTGEDIKEKISEVYELLKSENKIDSMLTFMEVLVGRPLYTYEEIFFSECFKHRDLNRENLLNHCIDNAIICREDFQKNDNIVDNINNIDIHVSNEGYYATISKSFNYMSDYYQSLNSLLESNIIDTLSNIK